jgi:hypothetical protein
MEQLWAGMMHPEAPVSGPQQHRKLLTRARVAGAILIVAMGSIAIGKAAEKYRSRAGNYWQARLVSGEPVVVRFICGTDAVVDCKISVKVTYQKQQSKWCEYLERSDQDEIYRARWCNANPELGTLSLFGVAHSFDRYGAVKNDGHLVGQLFLR